MQGLNAVQHISFLLVFLEGLLSFFSPCVLPLLPVYMSYLAGSGVKSQSGEPLYPRGRTLLHTLFFVLGISFAFFLLGLSFSVLGQFFNAHKTIFTRIGGIVILILGLVQAGFFEWKFLSRERRFHLNLAGKSVNPLIAFVMGFTFSFAWTPCVGPALSSVLILASGAKSVLTGNLLVLVYTLGFVLPFALLGFFTTQALAFLKHRQNLLRWTIKAGGVLLILIGFMTFTGWMNGVTGYLSGVPSPTSSESSAAPENAGSPESSSSSEEESMPVVPAPDFTLTDQYGNTHTLSDYQGKVVFLNFWATWCPPCRQEMPEIEELYKELGQNSDDVIILGMANPKSADDPYNREKDLDGVIQFLSDNGYTFPVVMDETGELFAQYGISAFPTTFMIDTDGNVFGYVSGALTKSMMESIIEQTKAGR